LIDPLKSAMLSNIDISQYLDKKRNVYGPVPIFPFLNQEEIKSAIDTIVDPKELENEIDHIQKSNIQSTIPGTSFIISLIDWHEYPALINILTIIREWAFRNEGGGTGGCDFDAFDTKDFMKQLVIINPDYDEPLNVIIGGYRYAIHESSTYAKGPMGDHFTFSDEWKSQVWIELGRSFINPYYQQKEKRQSFDYVLHGLGYIYAKNQHIKGYFGKVTLYNMYEKQKADQYFLGVAEHYFRRSELMYVNPSERIKHGNLSQDQKELLERDIFKGLFYSLRKDYNLNLVPIMAIYNRMVDLNEMYYFGAFRHDAFGNTTEVGIAIDVADIYEVIKEKFVYPYLS